MKESKIEKKACKLILDHLGVKGSKLITPGASGYPDRIFWLPGGKILLIEFKKPGEEPTAIQIKIHNQLRKLGHKVEVHDDAILAFHSIIEALGTTRLSKESREILNRARSICAVLRSRSGQNVNHVGRNKASKKEKVIR